MIMVQPKAEVREVTVPFCPDVRLPLILTIRADAQVRFTFDQIYRP